MNTIIICVAVAAVSAFLGSFITSVKKNVVITELKENNRKLINRAVSAEMKNDLQESSRQRPTNNVKSNKSSRRNTGKSQRVSTSSTSSADAGFMGWVAGLVASDDSSNSSRSHHSSSDYSSPDSSSSYSDSGSSSYDSGSY